MGCSPRRTSSARAGRSRWIAAVAACLLGGAVIASRSWSAGGPAGPLAAANRTPAEFPGIRNVFRLSERLITGSVPRGDAGFRSLQRLGIRTILTVDGARPDLTRAKRYGMRYVHLPFGYDGCPAPTAARIVRAVRDLPGPLYLHCHHGRNRAPAAAAFARIALYGLRNEEAVQEMARAGAGRNYTGLYRDVRAYRPPGKEEIDRVDSSFPAVAPTPPIVESMVQMQDRLEALLLARRQGWKTPTRNRDRPPAYEALQLRELFTEMLRRPEARREPAEFRRWLQDSERDGRALEAALRAGEDRRAGLLLGRVAATCGSCHVRYRNVPRPR